MLKQEGYDLMGAAFVVYNVLGYGMAEEIYQQSLEIEFAKNSVSKQSRIGCHVQRSEVNNCISSRPVCV